MYADCFCIYVCWLCMYFSMCFSKWRTHVPNVWFLNHLNMYALFCSKCRMGSHWQPDVSNASLKKNLILFKIGHSEQVHNDDPENNNIMLKHCHWSLADGTMDRTKCGWNLKIIQDQHLHLHQFTISSSFSKHYENKAVFMQLTNRVKHLMYPPFIYIFWILSA